MLSLSLGLILWLYPWQDIGVCVVVDVGDGLWPPGGTDTTSPNPPGWDLWGTINRHPLMDGMDYCTQFSKIKVSSNHCIIFAYYLTSKIIFVLRFDLGKRLKIANVNIPLRHPSLVS